MVGEVYSIAFSPDGTRIASGGTDGTVRLWTLDGEPAAAPFTGHEGVVLSVAFSPDGARIVSGGDDGTVRLWTLDGEQAAAPFAGHEGVVLSVAFSPDGTRIASGGDGTVRLWTLDGEPAAAPFTGHGDWVRSVAFSPDGTRIASGGDDGTVRLWTLDGEQAAAPFTGHGDWVRSVAFSPDGTRIASGSDDGTVRLWTLDGELAAAPFTGHEGWVMSVAFSPDGTRIASGADDGTVRLWTLDGEQAAAPFTGREGWVESVAFSPDGTRIASGGTDGTVRLWTLDGELAAATFTGHGDWVRSVAYSPDGTRIVSGGDDGTVRLWTLDGELAAAPFTGHGDWVRSVAFSPDGTRIASGGDDGTVQLWTLDGEQAAAPFTGHGDWVRSVAFSPDGTRIASGGDDDTVRLWSFEGEQAAAPFTGHEGWVLSVAFSPDGTRIVSGGGDGTVRLWTLDGEQAAAPFAGHEGWVLSVAFSPDGTRIASGGDDGTVRLWTLDGEQAAAPFAGHAGVVLSVAFSPDGTRIASGGGDGTVRLWTLGGTPLSTQSVGLFSVNDLAFGPSGRIVVGDSAGRLTVSDLAYYTISPPLWSWVLLVAGICGLATLGRIASRAFRDIVQRFEKDLDRSLPPVAAFLEADSPVDDPSRAGESMRGLTNRLSSFIRNRNTAAPLTFALTGEWGTGKSSVMKLVEHDLKRHRYPHVWFNAWHHQNEAHLFAALMEAIRREAAPPLLSWRNLVFRLRLASLRFGRAPIGNSFRVFAAVFALAVVGMIATTGAVWEDVGLLEKPSIQLVARTGFLVLAGFGVIWVLVGNLLKPFGVQPASLLSTSASWFQMARFQDRLGFRHRFGLAFNDVCRAFGDFRLVIIVDDLDRCKPELVVEILEAVNFLTTNGNCFVILGISERPVLHAVGLSFKAIAEELAAGQASTAGNEPDEEVGIRARTEFAEHYLEKLINLRIKVPDFDSQALGEWMDRAETAITAARQRSYGTARFLAGSLLATVLAVAAAVTIGTMDPPGPGDDTQVVGADTVRSETTVAERSESAIAAVEAQRRVVEDRRTIAAGETPPEGAKDALAEAEGELRRLERERDAIAAFGQFGQEGDAIAESRRTDSSQIGWSLWEWLIAIGGICVALMMLAFVDPRLRRTLRRSEDAAVLEDSDSFREAFAEWAPLVLARGRSPRSVKRFANRMRYLAAGLEGDEVPGAIHQLMTLGALDEIGLLTSDLDFNAWTQSTGWRTSVIEDLKAMRSPLDLRKKLGKITLDDWDHYWSLATSVRFVRDELEAAA